MTSVSIGVNIGVAIVVSVSVFVLDSALISITGKEPVFVRG